MNKKIKILLADDHSVVRNGLVLMLNQQKSFIPEIFEASDGNEVIAMVAKQPIDIVLMDVNLPKLDGIKTTKLLTKNYPKIKVLGVSMHNEGYIINQMLAAGAMGYLLKNTDIEELSKAILTVLGLEKYFSNEVSQSLIYSNALLPRKKMPGKFRLKELSGREEEVFILIVNELTNAQIAKKLDLSVRTVESHRNNILKKLKLKTSAGLIKYAIKHNIII